jgi:hypothetical protein
MIAVACKSRMLKRSFIVSDDWDEDGKYKGALSLELRPQGASALAAGKVMIYAVERMGVVTGGLRSQSKSTDPHPIRCSPSAEASTNAA